MARVRALPIIAVDLLSNMATSSSAASSTITMMSAISIGVGGALVAVLLILLLSSRELITASSKTSKKILVSLDSMILPLFVTFALATAFQVAGVLAPL